MDKESLINIRIYMSDYISEKSHFDMQNSRLKVTQGLARGAL